MSLSLLLYYCLYVRVIENVYEKVHDNVWVKWVIVIVCIENVFEMVLYMLILLHSTFYYCLCLQ